MNEETQNEVEAPVKKATKKAAPKKVAKKAAPAKKAVKKAAPKEQAKKEGIGKAQIRLLKALAKAKKPLNSAELAAKAEVHPTMIGSQVGYVDPEINEREVHAGNLVNRKYVKIEQHEPAEGERAKVVYSITAAGKAALDKAE